MTHKIERVKQEMVIKIQTDYNELAQEAKVLNKLKRQQEKDDNMIATRFPSLIAYGVFTARNIHQDEDLEEKDYHLDQYLSSDKNIYGYYIIPKYLFTLDAVQQILEPHEAFKIMSDVFAALENLHTVRYTHNDINPNNIMID